MTPEHRNQAGYMALAGFIFTCFATAGTAEWILSSKYGELQANYAVLAEKEATDRAEIESLKQDLTRREADQRISDALLLDKVTHLQDTWDFLQNELPRSHLR